MHAEPPRSVVVPRVVEGYLQAGAGHVPSELAEHSQAGHAREVGDVEPDGARELAQGGRAGAAGVQGRERHPEQRRALRVVVARHVPEGWPEQRADLPVGLRGHARVEDAAGKLHLHIPEPEGGRHPGHDALRPHEVADAQALRCPCLQAGRPCPRRRGRCAQPPDRVEGTRREAWPEVRQLAAVQEGLQVLHRTLEVGGGIDHGR
mmetsp:Transcript_98657/g.307361  ORF Transcript_98657/g.307361 Transcript_98657/m.307361 type:complete len:206 (+) Transcript_98657:67-684(+)